MICNVKSVKRYGYRSAMVMSRVLALSFERGDSIDGWRRELAEEANSRPDNHECYSVESMTGQVLHIQFSDWMCYVGFTIDVNPW